MNPAKHIVIIGATSAIAEHCARLWAADQPASITLVGRHTGRLQAIAADLKVRTPTSRIDILTIDFASPAAIHDLAENLFAQTAVDLMLIAHGTLPIQQQCQDDLQEAENALYINGISPALFAEAFAGKMQAQGFGQLGLIGSVAGDRGRKSNYTYGAAKGLVTRFAQGLQHRLAGSGVRVSLIKPGPTDTPMTSEFKARGARMASVEEVAAGIVNGMRAGRDVIYVPGKWKIIMMVIRHLPTFVFNKLDI